MAMEGVNSESTLLPASAGVHAVSHFESLLDEEKRCAIAADLQGLAALQEPKSQALVELHRYQHTEETRERLAKRARANLLLMRHIVAFYKSMTIDEGSSTYTTAGTRTMNGFSRPRGAL